MDHKKELEELHKQSISKLEEYIAAKSELAGNDKEKLHQSKTEWQVAWNRLMEDLLILEKIEI
jgi:hypothetical protein